MAERMSDNAVRARLRDEPETDEAAAPRRRLSPELLVGLVLVVGGALAGFTLVERSSDTITVVGAARNLPRGTVLARSDLVALDIGQVPATAIIQAKDASGALGRRLLTDVPQGTPIAPYVITEATKLADDEALIPVALEPGLVPAGLAAGDHVRAVISFPNGGTDAALPEVLPATVEVVDVGTTGEFGDQLRVTLRAPATMALDLARADRISLMKVQSDR